MIQAKQETVSKKARKATPKANVICDTGRRKTAVASVRLKPGTGKVIVNKIGPATVRKKLVVDARGISAMKSTVNIDRTLEDYFPLALQRKVILAPFEKAGVAGGAALYDIQIRVGGGGPEAQASAIRLAISRALVAEEKGASSEENASAPRHQALKEVHFLTRDSRKKERKKYGRKGARKRFQFSKR